MRQPGPAVHGCANRKKIPALVRVHEKLVPKRGGFVERRIGQRKVCRKTVFTFRRSWEWLAPISADCFFVVHLLCCRKPCSWPKPDALCQGLM